MAQFLPQLISAAVIGMISPVPTMATIVVLGARHAVRNAVALLLGWSTVLVLLAVVVNALFGDSQAASSDNTKAIVDVIIGILLLSFALRALLGGHDHPLKAAIEEQRARTSVPKWMQALDHLSAVKAFGLGAALLAISPANIAAYLSAMQGLKGVDVSFGRGVLVAVLIVAIDLCILVPLGVYVLMPRRAEALLSAGKVWLIDHQRALVGWVMAVFGVVLLVSGVTQLL